MNKVEVRIVIGQRGWVWVGEYSETPQEILLRKAKCIRRWGTPNEGLGALAQGPREGTILDKAGTVRMHPLAVVATYECDADAWQAALGN